MRNRPTPVMLLFFAHLRPLESDFLYTTISDLDLENNVFYTTIPDLDLESDFLP